MKIRTRGVKGEGKVYNVRMIMRISLVHKKATTANVEKAKATKFMTNFINA